MCVRSLCLDTDIGVCCFWGFVYNHGFYGVVMFVVCPCFVLSEDSVSFSDRLCMYGRWMFGVSGFHHLVCTVYLRPFLCDVKLPLMVVVGPACCLDMCDISVIIVSY